MKLAAQLLDRDHRDRNTEADAFANEDCCGFDLSWRVEAEGMICLPVLSAACSGFKEKLVSLMAQGPPGTAGSGAR